MTEMNGSIHSRLVKATMIGAVLAIAVWCGETDLVAQTSAEMTGLPVDLNGTWSVRRLPENRDLGPCFTRDSRTLPRIACRFPVEKLNVTARARAWMEFTDEPLEGKFFCIPEPINPHMNLRVESIEPNGEKVVWVFDGPNATASRQAGLHESALKKGETVKVVAHPARNPEFRGGYGMRVIKTDGSVFRFGGGREN